MRNARAHFLFLLLFCPLLCSPQSATVRDGRALSLCQILAKPGEYLGTEVRLRVEVHVYRHGTAISDQACPKQELALKADQSGPQSDSVSRFYNFLAKHRQSSVPIVATVTGQLAKGPIEQFVLNRNFVFQLMSVSEVSEDTEPKP